MATTDILGLVYADESSPASINAATAALAGSVDAKVGPYASDTGWVSVPASAPASATIRYRKVGMLVQVTARGATTSGNFPAKSAVQIAGAGSLPAAVRPAFNMRGSGSGSGSSNVILSAQADGSVYVINQDTVTATSMEGYAVYFTG